MIFYLGLLSSHSQLQIHQNASLACRRRSSGGVQVSFTNQGDHQQIHHHQIRKRLLSFQSVSFIAFLSYLMLFQPQDDQSSAFILVLDHQYRDDRTDQVRD